MTRWLALLLLAPLAACQAHVHAAAGVPPLGDEAEVFVYLRPLPPEAERLGFEIASLDAVGADGAEVPLHVRMPSVARAHVAGERLLAWGRVPPGDYTGLAVHVSRATLAGEAGPADLVVPAEPARADLSFAAGRGAAVVVALELRYPPSLERTFRFAPAFAAAIPDRVVPDAAALCANAGMASVTVLDRRAHRISAVVPTAGSPRAVVLDRAARRAYVAVAGAAEVEALDLASGASLGVARLSPGDEPADVALTPDGRTLVVADEGSGVVSFVDPASLAEVKRVPAGDAPSAVLLDREGRRAYVLSRRSATLTVLDVANRAVVTTVATDPEPLRAALDAAGRRLYVVAAGSPYMTVLSVPDLAPAGRVFVGLGASGVLVDSRTDLVYVARADERQLQVFDPYSLAPVTFVDVPAPVGFMAIDDAENALWAVMPEARALAVVDLTTRALLATLDVGDAPAALALTGARP